MINKLKDFPTFSLFNNYELIRKIKDKLDEIIDSINSSEGSEVISADERKVGSFFGEDLYEKTVIINLNTELDKYGYYYFPANVKQLVDAEVQASKSNFVYNAENTDEKYKLNAATSGTIRTNYFLSDAFNDGVEKSTASIAFAAYSNYNYAMVTIKYTKF